jgi:peroxisomal biogenesis factor 11 (PEX11)
MADQVPKKLTDDTPAITAKPDNHNVLVLPIVKLDRLLARLTIILATPAGTDSLLRTVTYTMQFLTGGLTNIMNNHMDKVVSLVTAVSRLLRRISPPSPKGGSAKGPPSKSTGLTSYLPKPPALVPAVIQTVPRAKALSSLINDFRSFTRLWGLLGMYAWGKSLLTNPPKDPILRLVAYGQCLAYTAYQGYENRGYLAGKGIWLAKREGKDILADWLWSSRMWMIGVGLEFVRLLRVRQLWGRRVMTEEERKKESASWWREMIANLANAPLTVHWSVAGGTLDDMQVGFLGMVAGLVGLMERWKMAGDQLRARRG